MSTPVKVSPAIAAAIQARLNAARDKYGLDHDHGYLLTAQHPGAQGTTVARFTHTYKGVPIYQSESVVVSDAAGKIISESASDRRGALGVRPSPTGSGLRYSEFNVHPGLSAQDAIGIATGSAERGASSVQLPSAQLIIYPLLRRARVPSAVSKLEYQLTATDLVDKVVGYELAWLVKSRMIVSDRPVFRDVIVSAVDGHVIAQWDALQTAVGVGHSQYNGQVPLSTSPDAGKFSMKDPQRGKGGTYGMNAVTNANHGSTAGNLYVNPTNEWGDGRDYIPGGPTDNANGQTAAVNAMWGMMNTYDTLKNVLGWHSLDGNDTATYIAVHVYTGYDNAYYMDDCKCMFIGDGGSYFYNLGAIDVIGHEMGHGVTAATSNLTYYGESGGLNESASDINGEMTEAYARNGGTGNTIPATGNDWVMGQEIGRNGDPLRWMYKPSKDGTSPDAWSSNLGNLDVHYSSGPNNRMFYFLSQGSSADRTSDRYSPYLTKSPAAMTGIGSDKAYRIWFRALTTKFTSSTNYAVARDKVIEAARDLYGANSKEAIAVQRAYAAINVGSDVDEQGGTSTPVKITSQPHNVSVAPGATASFSVTVEGGTTPYKYQWRRNGADIAGATSATYSFTAKESDNGATFSVKVTDSGKPPVSVTSSDAKLIVSSRGPSDLVTNGGFESGAAGWAGTTGVIGSWGGYGQSPYEGTMFAYLGGNGRMATENLTQEVTIPADATSAKLSFALHVDTAELTRMVAYDKLQVQVKSQSGAVLGTLATFSNLDAAAGYQVRTFDLSAYKGQTVVLSFLMNEDYSLQTSFTVDQVSLMAQ